MNYAIIILKKELKHWKEFLEYNKEYYKGEENDKWAIQDFKEANKNISELAEAIKKLKP